MADPKWLGLVQQMQALAQDGLAYAHSPFDRERYHADAAVDEDGIGRGAPAGAGARDEP